MSSAVTDVLNKPPGGMPLYLTAFRIDVIYQPGMAPDEERQEVLEEAFAELEDALRLGFFSGERFSARESAGVQVSWREDGGMSVTLSSAGSHSNALVAALRIVVRLHHTSIQAYEALRALLGEDADALPQPTSFRENIASLTVSDVAGEGENGAAEADLLHYIPDGITVPDLAGLDGNIGESYEGGRLVISSVDGDIFPAGDLGGIEDCFLRLCGSGVFTPIADLDLDVSDNEAEIFSRIGDGGAEILFGDYENEKYGIIEFLAVISGGNVARLAIHQESIS